VTVPSIKSKWNPPSGTSADTCRQTDGREEGTRRYSWRCEPA